ncbi:hypothetical protein CMI48_01625 [Candidatus Pacearchaeota archaeon]|nr:hypothetical protein [Candidatus Pacearchaeota archaeon]
MLKYLFSKKNNLAEYNENRMSPFDAFALEELVSSFGRNDLTCLEIGSWFGAGSTQIIGKFSEELVCVDHWQGNENEEHREIVATIDVFKRFVANTSKFDGRVKPIRGSSQDVCPLLEKMKYDFIFIDGDHRYSSTVQDIKSTLPLLKPGGILAGHDCEGRISSKILNFIDENKDIDHVDSIYPDFVHCHPGVIKAVYELIEQPKLYAEKRLELDNGMNGFSTIWWTRV